MSSVTCESCTRFPSFCCYCSEIPVLLCEVHLIRHQKTLASHMITPYTYEVTEQKSKLLRKMSELLSSSEMMISYLITSQTQQIELIQSTLSSTIIKINSFQHYLENLYAEVCKISHISYKPSNTPVEKVLLDPDIDKFLEKITHPTYYSKSVPGDIIFISSNLEQLMASMRPEPLLYQTVNPSRRKEGTKVNNNLNNYSVLDEPRPIKQNSSYPNLNIKKESCIGCSKFAVIFERHCGHQSCNECLKNRCAACQLDDSDLPFLQKPSHLPKSKIKEDVCSACKKVGIFRVLKCGHICCDACFSKKSCEACSRKKRFKCLPTPPP